MRPYLFSLIVIALLLSAPLLAFGQPISSKTDAPAMPKTVQIDPNAMALLAKVDAKMHGLKTYSADFAVVFLPNKMRGETQESHLAGSVRLMQPNFAEAEGWTEDTSSGSVRKASLDQVFASDGKKPTTGFTMANA